MAPRTNKTPDSALIARARVGDAQAYGVLWSRHAAAGVRFAGRVVRHADAEDLASEAFANIFTALQNGQGPHDTFRPYLYVTIRNLGVRWLKYKAEPTIDGFHLDLLADPTTEESDRLDPGSLKEIADAFASLPTRWQEVLWYTEVEQLTPSEIAPLLGMSSNSVSALSYRAREGMRRKWIESHSGVSSGCDAGLRIEAQEGKQSPLVAQHLGSCTYCGDVETQSRLAMRRLRLVLPPLLLGGVAGRILLDTAAREGAKASALSAFASPTTANAWLAAAHLPNAMVALALATALSLGSAFIITDPSHSPAAPNDSHVQGSEEDSDSASHGVRPVSDTADEAPAPVPTAPQEEQTDAVADRAAPAPPSLTTSINPTDHVPPTLTGGAEPRARVSIGDGAAEMSSAVADAAGAWTTGTLPIQPFTRQIVITQTDGAGNVSQPLIVTPGYHPVADQSSPLIASSVTVLNLTGTGWPGALYRVYVDGNPVDLGAGPVQAIPPHGSFGIYRGWAAPGVHDITFGYVDPATSLITVPVHFTVDIRS